MKIKIYSLTFLLIFILCSSKIYSSTSVSGRISTNTTWTKVSSPYIVTSTIQVYGNGSDTAILTIDPGVEVRFESGTSLQIGSRVNKGILRAIGTETDTTKFTANVTSPVRGSWGRIYIDDNSVDYDTTNGTGTILENCVIEYGGGNSTIPANIHIEQRSWRNTVNVSIKNSVIKNSKSNGIYNYAYIGATVTTNITNCEIKDNAEYGVLNINSSLTIVSSIINNNTQGGIYSQNSSPTINKLQLYF